MPKKLKRAKSKPRSEVSKYTSTIFAPVEPHPPPKPPTKCKNFFITLFSPIWCICKKIWVVLCFLNKIAGNPVGEPSNTLNGCIFVATMGVLQHSLQILIPQSTLPKNGTIMEMYQRDNDSFISVQIEDKIEILMLSSNVLILLSIYSIIWQPCLMFLFLYPFYLVYVVYSIVHRHFYSSKGAQSNEHHPWLRSLEQGVRLLFLLWQFCVVVAFARIVRADRLAKDRFIQAKRRRLYFINKTRRREDRLQFLRDPIRQKTILLVSDPKRPWMKQTLAAKLAENAFAENEAVASLWAPVAMPIEVPQKSKQIVKAATSKKSIPGSKRTRAFSFLPDIPSFFRRKKKSSAVQPKDPKEDKPKKDAEKKV